MADEVKKKVKKGKVRKYIGKPIITPKNYFKIELDTEIDKDCKTFNHMIISALNSYVNDCMKHQREPETFEFIEFLEEFEEELERENEKLYKICENLKSDYFLGEDGGLYVEES